MHFFCRIPRILGAYYYVFMMFSGSNTQKYSFVTQHLLLLDPPSTCWSLPAPVATFFPLVPLGSHSGPFWVLAVGLWGVLHCWDISEALTESGRERLKWKQRLGLTCRDNRQEEQIFHRCCCGEGIKRKKGKNIQRKAWAERGRWVSVTQGALGGMMDKVPHTSCCCCQHMTVEPQCQPMKPQHQPRNTTASQETPVLAQDHLFTHS